MDFSPTSQSTAADAASGAKTLSELIGERICGVPETEDAMDVAGYIASAVGGLYFAIYHIWMETHSYVCFQDRMEGVLDDIGVRGKVEPAFEAYIQKYVVAEDRAALEKFTEFATLGERLRDATAITHEFRRIGIGWARGQFIVARRNADGTPSNVIFTVSDITAEKKLAEREENAVYAMNHDALTGLLNRKAFDDALAARAFSNREVGFLMVDIDRFKELNDEFGHKVGDKIIAGVAETMSALFRREDSIFRIGGDEFVVFLPDRNPSCWEALCRKFELIHARLTEELPEGCHVTLSCGACFGHSGVEGWMYHLADEALFNTKRNGRAGCTLIDRDGTVLDSWRDEEASRGTYAALAGANAAICRVEVSLDGSKPNRLICGEALRDIFSIPAGTPPEEAFDLWYGGIDPDSRGAVADAARMMSTTRNVEFTFRWQREGTEPFVVRAIGTGVVTGNVKVFYGIQRSLAGATIVGEDVVGLAAARCDESEAKLRKVTESLTAALEASHQISWEYDPATHVGTCYTANNLLNLPQHIENYPEALRGTGAIHPDDEDLLFGALERISAGSGHEQCDVRLMTEGRYRWYACRFDAHRGTDGRTVAICLATDITVRVAATEAITNRMGQLLRGNTGASHLKLFNLTTGKVQGFEDDNEHEPGSYSDVGDYDQALEVASATIVDPEEREAYRRMFSAQNLVDLARAGVTSTSMECLAELTPGNTEWVRASAEMIVNPATDEVESIGYVRSVNALHIADMLVRAGMDLEFPMVAILINGGDEYYLYDRTLKVMCQHRRDFWNECKAQVGKLCTLEENRAVASMLKPEPILEALHRGENPQFTITATHDGRRKRYVMVFSVLDERNDIVSAALKDVTDDEAEAVLRHAARHDALTDLYNREAFFLACRRMLDENPAIPFRMVEINVRRFRLYNASFGEKAGDELLCAIAEGIRKTARETQPMAYGRIEADIFCVLAPRQDPESARRHMAFIKEGFASYSEGFLLEPSIGIYDVVDPAMPIESMFARTTAATRENAKTTKDASAYTDELEVKLNDELLIANDIRSALDRKQLAVYLQPQYSLQTGERAGAEALVRWVHPTRGLLPPAKFIPIFEDNGLIATLDRYMWESVCQLLRKWLDEGRDVKPVSVNMSRVSAFTPSTVSFLHDLAERYRIDPELLEIELTESAYIDDPEDIKRTLNELRGLGFSILMDDFGSGYSSLNTLRELPIDVVKLDKNFLSDSCDDPSGRIVLSSTIEMTNRLGLPTVAEGVETQEQADFLRKLGCQYAQGYLFAKPMPVSEFEQLP